MPASLMSLSSMWMAPGRTHRPERRKVPTGDSVKEFILFRWWGLKKFLLNHLLGEFKSLGIEPTNVETFIELKSLLSKPNSLNYVDNKSSVVAALKKVWSESKSRLIPDAGFVTKSRKKKRRSSLFSRDYIPYTYYDVCSYTTKFLWDIW